MTMNRHIIHIHIPAFQITVERLIHPKLRERPVVVASPQSERAIILSVSPEAKREGIFKGMALHKAVRFCPDLAVLHPNPELTEKGGMALSRTAAKYTPVWESARPGHIYMDITGTARLWGKAKDMALRISREIKNGLSLPGAIGVAGNKMVSSIASRIMRSNTVLDVDQGRESAFMAPLKVDYLPSIGHVRKKMLLEELNITLIREIAVMDIYDLRVIFGKEAFVIHQRALGIDPTPVYPPEMKPSVSESATLRVDENDDHRLLGLLYSMVEKCSRKMRERNLIPHKAGLSIRYSDHVEAASQVKLSIAHCFDSDLHVHLEKLFLKTCSRRTTVRFIRVWFRDFSSPSPQLSLFTPDSATRKRNALLAEALDHIRKRHGEAVIRYGRALAI
jgi:DNA polymerase-4